MSMHGFRANPAKEDMLRTLNVMERQALPIS